VRTIASYFRKHARLGQTPSIGLRGKVGNHADGGTPPAKHRFEGFVRDAVVAVPCPDQRVVALKTAAQMQQTEIGASPDGSRAGCRG
jgi:hypothetical protein